MWIRQTDNRWKHKYHSQKIISHYCVDKLAIIQTIRSIQILMTASLSNVSLLQRAIFCSFHKDCTVGNVIGNHAQGNRVCRLSTEVSYGEDEAVLTTTYCRVKSYTIVINTGKKKPKELHSVLVPWDDRAWISFLIRVYNMCQYTSKLRNKVLIGLQWWRQKVMWQLLAVSIYG